MTIPIRNLYFIFCYAWAQFPGGQTVDVGVDECPDLQNLFAKVLVEGVNRLIRRGLDRGYREIIEETRSPRGRLMLDDIVKEQTLRRGAVICRYDELSYDVVHNQIIKATARSLAREPTMTKELGHELRMIERKLARVSDIRLSADLFRRVQLSRNTGPYRVLMQLCQFVFRSLMPDEQGTGGKFADVLDDEVVMSKVFEEFLRNFYMYEADDYRVARDGLEWAYAQPIDAMALKYLPRMQTDVTLVSANRVKVFDAKFYKKPFDSRYDTPKIHSGNLYQLVTYLQHTALRYPGRNIDGALIYAAIGEPVSLSYRLLGYDVQVEAVDLTQPWPEIKSALLEILMDQSAGVSSGDVFQLTG